MADAWMQRAYFGQFEEAEEAAAEAERLEEERERQEEAALDRDEFGSLLDDWLGAGGDKDELFKAVEKLIEDKGNEEVDDDGDGENARGSDTNTGSN